MPVQQTNHYLARKETVLFAVLTAAGATAVMFGLSLIIFAHYHERAYVFLILGAGGFMGGIAGMVVVRQKARAAFDYGLTAMGIVGLVIGLNYLTGEYGPEPNLVRGYLVLTLGMSAVLLGLALEMLMLPGIGFVGFSSVFIVGVIGSIGLAALIVGTVCLALLDYPARGYFLLATGSVCLVGGIAWMICVQRKASTSQEEGTPTRNGFNKGS